MADGPPGPEQAPAPPPKFADGPLIEPVEKRGERTDDFYRSWSRFTARGTGLRSSKRSKQKDTVPSLDIDVEGKPGHRVQQVDEGVVVQCQPARKSYESAAANCKAKVKAIVAECTRLNIKYTDRAFEIGNTDSMMSLGAAQCPEFLFGVNCIGSVKRVEEIFENPQFFEDGPTADDVKQGNVGDCWFLAAATAMSGCPNLIEKICVARDEKVGVYGFVFFRDGEWVSEVIDDRLCLNYEDDDDKNFKTEWLLKMAWNRNINDTKFDLKSLVAYDDYQIMPLEKEVLDSLHKGSNALYFASCKSSNETWLPLLEKAYAKAHGDYQAINGGIIGEGIEDLTGGVATYLKSRDVRDKDVLWKELTQVNERFLFGCSSRAQGMGSPIDEEGFVRGHAYTVLEAREITAKPKVVGKGRTNKLRRGSKVQISEETPGEKVRLLRIHNPWGKGEWRGAWSDGSQEWTPDIMRELDHTFGDDGIFWITYDDFLKYYPAINRIRLIGDDWFVAQQWTSVNVPWTTRYLDTTFKLIVTKSGPVVILLNQPDSRYFRGMIGRYNYELHFRLYKEGEEVYMLRSMQTSGSDRSCTAELDLEPGTYFVHVKINAGRDEAAYTQAEMINAYRDVRPQKLENIGKSYDLAHSKGKLKDMEKANKKEKKTHARLRDQEGSIQQRKDKRAQKERTKLKNQRREAEEKRKKEAKKKAKQAEREVKKTAEKASDPKPGSSDESNNKSDRAAPTEEKKEGEVGKSANVQEPTKADNINQDPEPTVETKVDASESTPKGTDLKENPTSVNGAEAAVISSDVAKSTDDSKPAEEAKPAAPKAKAEEAAPIADSKPVEMTNASKDAEVPQDAKLEGGQASDAVKPADTRKTAEVTGPAVDSKDTANDKPTTQDEKADEKPAPTQDPDQPPPLPAKAPDADSDDDAVSEVSSVMDDDFDWDPALDGPLPSDDSDFSDLDSEDDSDTRFSKDPWNAVCVIGLRVCSEKDDGLQIDIVYTNEMDGVTDSRSVPIESTGAPVRFQ